MKNILIIGAIVIVVLGGILVFTNNTKEDMNADVDTMNEEANRPPLTEGAFAPSDVEEVPEGYHRMPDGSLMKNEDMVGMGSDEMMEDINDGEEVVVDLDGFYFGYSQEEIRVNEGDTVTINLTSTDGYHDWVVDEFGVATDKIKEGETTSVTFVADQKGTYEFYCSVGSHRAQGMVGALVVE